MIAINISEDNINQTQRYNVKRVRVRVDGDIVHGTSMYCIGNSFRVQRVNIKEEWLGEHRYNLEQVTSIEIAV